ncbi:hypothetical protein [Hymenobacter sp. B81]|uniref:hypothetical protein n=1 Tax=Hymenobacter sp. B81 TaxID=3344878 RepID=UPI0037DC75B5
MYSIAVSAVRLSFWRYFYLAWRFTLKANPLIWVIVLPLLPVVLFVGQLLTGAIPFASWFSGGTLFFWFLLAIFLMVPVQMARTYRQTPLLNSCTSYDLSDAGLKVDNPTQRVQLDWSVVPRAYRFGSWLVLLSGQQQGFFLNLDCVQGPHAADTVLRLLRHHGVDVR